LCALVRADIPIVLMSGYGGATLATPALAAGANDADSLYVDGYFEETKLPHIHVGDRVSVRLMGESRVLYGRVQSVAPAIYDRERTPTGDLVADINPRTTCAGSQFRHINFPCSV
jgi:multidrug resistance efflux pump